MSNLKLLTILLSALFTTIGLFAMVAPLTLVEFTRSLQTPIALYIVAAVRIVFGALLLWVAPTSRTPRTLRVIGAVIVVSGLLTPAFGIRRAQAMLDWWAGQGLFFMRTWAAFAIGFGIFFIYTVAGSRRTDDTSRKGGHHSL